LGELDFPEGLYVYCGSARKNLAHRLARHCRKDKKVLRWHIDYLLNHPAASIEEVRTSNQDECELVQQTIGEIVAAGFGSSDCRSKCGAHLKRIVVKILD